MAGHFLRCRAEDSPRINPKYKVSMGDSVRCASYERSTIYGCISGYEHQIIDFFDSQTTGPKSVGLVFFICIIYIYIFLNEEMCARFGSD